MKRASFLCIELTEKYKILSAKMESEADDVMKHLFGEFSDEQIDDFFNSILKLSRGIEALDMYFQKNKIG